MNFEEAEVGLDISEDIVPARPVVSSSIVSQTFDGFLDPPLKLQTNQTQCGGQLWPAGLVLAEYLLREQMGDLRGKKILELGAGSGLTGLAIALGLQRSKYDGPSSDTSILLTDGLQTLIPLLEKNIELNSLSLGEPVLSVEAAFYSWGQSPGPAIILPDVILAADCAYLEEAFPLLVKTLTDTMSETTVLWFCYKRRRKRDKDCLKLIGKVFSVHTVKGTWERESVFLYEIRRKRIS